MCGYEMNFDAKVGTVFTQFVFICADPEEGGREGHGPDPPLENYKNIGFL